MRGLMALGLAWSILICATPGLADRFGTNPQPASAPVTFAEGPVAEARVLPASEVRAACQSVETPGDTDRDPGTGSVILARYDPATDNPFQHPKNGSQFEANSTGLCR